MKKELFEKWLIKEGVGSYRQYISRIKSIEEQYGNIDGHFNKDGCADLLEIFSYSKEDRDNKVEPKHNLLSKSLSGKDTYQLYYEGSNDFKTRINRYIAFRNALAQLPLYENLKQAADINPDKHDGSYELVREAVKIFAAIPESEIDYADLDAMWFLCIGTFRFGLIPKRNKIEASHLSPENKEKLVNIMDHIWNRAENGEYENREKGAITVGMFGTGFGTFKGSVTDETAKQYIRMCIDINNIDNESKILDIADEALKSGMKGIGSASSSQFLHCLKPDVFPIINGRYGEGTIIFDCLGIPLEDTANTKNYIHNTKNIIEFRNKHFTFKNMRVFDLIHVDTSIFDLAYGDIAMINERAEDYGDYQTIYDYCKAVYKGTITVDVAAKELSEKVTRYNEVSHKMSFITFKGMLEGVKFTRRANADMTKFFLNHIAVDFGEEALDKALHATYLNIQYFYEQTGQKQQSMRNACQEVANEHGKTIKFDETMFNGLAVISQTTGNDPTGKITLCWYVGAYNVSENKDWSEQYISNGTWINGYTDKYLDIVNSVKEGDKIAIKTSYVQKKDLPFNVNGGTVSVMGIKAVGTVTKNHKDGRTLDVEWKPFSQPKKWYFFTSRATIWKVEGRINDWMYQALLDFTFSDEPQDYDRFLSHPYWEEKYLLNENEAKVADDVASENEANVEDDVAPDFDEIVSYTSDDFLKEVFISEDSYTTICELLLRKKNIILQGAPGVGKTFIAKRLAYSIMQETDESRVSFIQFHQNYSYEDFIMGYRPTGNGFTMKYGAFYNFCQKAAAQPDRKHFFIIDEINRGNLSKILGELLMLIESDKRGPNNKINLAYTGQPFYVPDNLYIIGMMNTADRSLAIIDYALRRRFCFIELLPAFELFSFREFLEKNNVDESLCEKIISRLTFLNKEIENDPSLGKGFRIGHSYFCDCKNANTEWYENIIKYEIAPMLEEYWFDDLDKAKELTEELLG